MFYQPTLIIRHRRENKKKCTLQPIIHRTDCQFLRYPSCKLPNTDSHFLLSFDGPALSEKDQHLGIILLDGTWKRAACMYTQLFKGRQIEKRSLPQHFVTAYPRRQLDCDDPDRGLASIEALYLAYKLLGREDESLLNGYHWKEQFLQNNLVFF